MSTDTSEKALETLIVRHLTGSDRVVAWTAAAFSLALVGLWVHLHGVTPFTG